MGHVAHHEGRREAAEVDDVLVEVIIVDTPGHLAERIVRQTGAADEAGGTHGDGRGHPADAAQHEEYGHRHRQRNLGHHRQAPQHGRQRQRKQKPPEGLQRGESEPQPQARQLPDDEEKNRIGDGAVHGVEEELAGHLVQRNNCDISLTTGMNG